MPEILKDLSLAELAAPIDGGSGEDLSFSALFDQIKEARRADPDYLTQGDWQTDLKTADWEQVIQLSAQGLIEQSKDLMLVAWLSEGLAHREHFDGITFGLELTERILDTFWESAYPSLDDGLEERAARLSWLKTTLTDIAGGLPITQGQNFGVLRYDESRHVENLALQNPKAMQTALNEGKINAEIFQRSVALSDTEHLRDKALQLAASLQACNRLQTSIDRLFGHEAPSFASLADMLTRASQLAEKLLKDRGVELHPAALTEATPDSTAAHHSEADEQMSTPALSATPAPMRTTPLTRDEAFTMLAGIAQFFKQSEPQSPVPYLIERAIKWGNMPLEGWLSDVIKDSNVVDNIRDVLGTRERS
ncbi:type VI secretion system protein TssA [Pseudomonas promysalinigenes]|uniref:Type VI secretion system protein TssA n=1 Tax=Pseudomonas promysalinigenes TaxID=485898 RepID=A0ABY6AS69_9PSED|nr:type VI secretion system protein TssA [Pseudomonas promysalinigenes]UXH42163.1 type VI secretion system protein TssA [Pseudomonas promysalinigenes]